MKSSRLVGSMGMYNPLDVRTAGGGHIHMNIDSLWLEDEQSMAHISCNGLPKKDTKVNADLNGGSGGYIYINTT